MSCTRGIHGAGVLLPALLTAPVLLASACFYMVEPDEGSSDQGSPVATGNASSGSGGLSMGAGGGGSGSGGAGGDPTSAPLPEDTEPNNLIDDIQAGPEVTADRIIRGSFSDAADVDYYRLHVEHDAVLRIETFDAAGRCDVLNTKLTLYASSGWEILSDEDHGIGTCSSIVSFVPAGLYYVRAEQIGAIQAAPYVLEFMFYKEATDFTEKNAFVRGYFDMKTLSATHTVNVSSGETIRAEVIGAEIWPHCWSGQLYNKVTIQAPSNLMISSVDGAGMGRCALLNGVDSNFFANAGEGQMPTPYKIIVEKGNGGIGSYPYGLVITVRSKDWLPPPEP